MESKTRQKYEARAQVIKAMAHPTRLFIVDELAKGERCVCELRVMIGADISTVSKHLSVLKQAGIVEDYSQKCHILQLLMEKYQPEGKYLKVDPNEPLYNKIVDRTFVFKIESQSIDIKIKLPSGKPDEYKQKVEELREKIMESAAESDDALLEAYFDAGTLTEEQLQKGLRKGILQQNLIPVLCGSAERNMGSHQLLDIIGSYGVSPKDFGIVKGKDAEGKNDIERKIDAHMLGWRIFR